MWGPEPITARRLEVLLLGLPDESETVRTTGGVRPGQWHNVEELLATLIEVVFEGHRLLYAVHAKRGHSPPKSLKVPRPDREGRQTPKQQSTTQELVQAFGSSSKVVVRYTPKES